MLLQAGNLNTRLQAHDEEIFCFFSDCAAGKLSTPPVNEAPTDTIGGNPLSHRALGNCQCSISVE